MIQLFISYGEGKETIDNNVLDPSLKKFQKPLTREMWIEACKSIDRDAVDIATDASRNSLINKIPDKINKINYRITKGVITAR
ncbi:hypothetical protein [Chryseobacterium potabilaquae]|uniref:Uncharacterized protein n=1 Tax=Chryseobacterium potabilaquae TaxID=2675057 RepID=A0A6N4X3S0_9FLAO|nr:hypothetical protein [Chryseobacterium potabilaquae]CAA7194079.1 hypothetical protein CHRY9293_00458 [Chryseobacterium potabilaquae]